MTYRKMTNRRRVKKSLGILLTMSFFAFSVQPTLAQETAKEANSDKWRLAFGGYAISRYDSTIAVSPEDRSAAVGFDPDKALGLENDQTVLRFDGSYRFLPKHTLTYSWYRINSDARKSIADEIDWVDRNGNAVTIPIGTTVASDFQYDIHKLGYLWSFYRTDKVELAAGAGFHITNIDFGLDAEATFAGSSTESVSTSLPLPVFSFSINYHVTEKFLWYVNTELFAMSFDSKWQGSYTDISLAMEYQFTDHLGAGVGIGNNALRVRRDDDVRINYENRITGIQLYAVTYF